MTKGKVFIEDQFDIDAYINGPLDEFAERIDDGIEHYMKTYHGLDMNASTINYGSIEISCLAHYTGADLKVEFRRIESDKEYRERLDKERQLANIEKNKQKQKEEKEIAELKRLAEKYPDAL